ncbi:MAG TPA: hypothetical protein VML55_07500 [Planctomycetaceae bacterium]|nr:hypothetical protein [Planctomycetaceae bacterium]
MLSESAKLDEKPPPDSAVLYSARRVRVYQCGSGVTVVESRYPRFWILLAPMLVVDVAFLAVLCVGWWARGPFSRSIAANLGVALATLLALVLLGAALLGTAQAILPRRLLVDRTHGACRLRHVPGFGRNFRFDDITAVYVVTFAGLTPLDQSAFRCDVALGLKGSKRLLRIHTAAGCAKLGVQLIAVCQPLADTLAERLGCPVEIEQAASYRRISLV